MGTLMIRRPLAVLAVGAGLLTACSSGGHSTPAGPLAWGAGVPERINGGPGHVDVATVCGSSTDQFLEELLHHPVPDLKVMREWGDIAPAGRQVLVSGTVADLYQGPGDLPMDHPFGDDLSMDIQLASPFTAFSQKLGTAPSDTKPGQFHVEISSGLIPHLPASGPAPAGETWRQASDRALTGFQPGFAHPAVGDPVLIAGRYILDCGHPDFHTELHPVSFIAWAHRDATATTVHLYANPYWDTELFSPDFGVLGRVGDQSRAAAADTKPLPKYLVDEVVRLVTGKTDRLHTPELVGASAPLSTNWDVCAPAGTSGQLSITYDLRTRPGVTAAVTRHGSNCATVRLSVGRAYRPADVPIRTCAMPWAYVNSVAGQALATPVDARKIIADNLPASARPLLDRDPLAGCADPLAGSALAAAPGGQVNRSDPAQAIPVYGIVTVSRP